MQTKKKTLQHGAIGFLCVAILGILFGFATVEPKNENDKMSKTLIVYYSYTNHTKMIAERIQKVKGYDILRLELTESYPDDYSVLETLAKKQADEQFAPEIKPLNVDLTNYDTIVLGTPVWWYTFAPAVRSFLKNNDLSGKTIIPYATNAGWLGHTFEDIKTLCPKSEVKNELSIKFSGEAKDNKILTPEREIEEWMGKLK